VIIWPPGVGSCRTRDAGRARGSRTTRSTLRGLHALSLLGTSLDPPRPARGPSQYFQFSEDTSKRARARAHPRLTVGAGGDGGRSARTHPTPAPPQQAAPNKLNGFHDGRARPTSNDNPNERYDDLALYGFTMASPDGAKQTTPVPPPPPDTTRDSTTTGCTTVDGTRARRGQTHARRWRRRSLSTARCDPERVCAICIEPLVKR
jgi:hypothetical protein